MCSLIAFWLYRSLDNYYIVNISDEALSLNSVNRPKNILIRDNALIAKKWNFGTVFLRQNHSNTINEIFQLYPNYNPHLGN